MKGASISPDTASHIRSRIWITASAEEHKLLFALAYNREVHLDDCELEATVLRIANIVAMAEYWDLLPKVASQLVQYLLAMPGLWKDVAAFPLLYLALGKKLRSTEIYSDALRHFIGSGRDPSCALRSGVLTRSEAGGSSSHSENLCPDPHRRRCRSRSQCLFDDIRRTCGSKQEPSRKASTHEFYGGDAGW